MLMADRFHRKFRSSPGKFSTGLSTDLWIGFDDTLTVDPARPSPRPRFSPYQSYAPEIPRYLCEDALPGAQMLRLLEITLPERRPVVPRWWIDQVPYHLRLICDSAFAMLAAIPSACARSGSVS